MSRYFVSIAGLAVLIAALPVSAQRVWIVYPSSYEGSFQDHPTGEFDGGGQLGGGYRWGEGFDGVRRGYWNLTKDNVIPVGHSEPFPAKPATYFLEQWVPSSTPSGVTWDSADWTELPVEVTYDGPGGDEEAMHNLFIPWEGQFNTNHQWIKTELNEPEGTWKQAGPGPQAPDDESCFAWGNGPNSDRVWLKRGSTLYTKWNFGGPSINLPAHPITAIRITEAVPFTPTCDSATLGGPVDLRCIGNADPLYFQDEAFGGAPGPLYGSCVGDPLCPVTTRFKSFSNEVMSFDGNAALAVDDFIVGTCFYGGTPYNIPLTPGLPASGSYTAQLPDGNVTFQLRYDGFNTIKWKTEGVPDVGGEFDETRVFTLNEVPDREFVSGEYGKLHFLSVTSGQSAGMLIIEAVYDDATTDIRTVNLYDWFGQDGDATSIPVGFNGLPKSTVGAIGFGRVNREGVSDGAGGGDANGAWLMAHTVEVDPCKTLSQVNLSISPEVSGRVQVIAATFEPQICKDCPTPIFDVAGGGPNRDEPDGSVDQYDFAAFQRCLTGPDPDPGVFDPENCVCMDVDNNQVVDDYDFQFFLNCYTGPALGPPPAGCDEP